MRHGHRVLAATALLLTAVGAAPLTAETLYRYVDADGTPVFTDRVPPPEVAAETRDLGNAQVQQGVHLSVSVADRELRLDARNDTYAPVQIDLELDALHNVALPPPAQARAWVLAPRSTQRLLVLAVEQTGGAPGIEYRYRWFPGDPQARHAPAVPYRAPFARAGRHPVTQAWPDVVTHGTPDSRHAVDIAMPIGTDVFAARGGIVVDVEYDRFRSGLGVDLDDANLIRILHDDGTFAVYAHLNRATIRVRAGQRVARGDYIADSGNTGFSSGPHLHFAVLRNAGMRFESVPLEFAGPGGNTVTPQSGTELVAY